MVPSGQECPRSDQGDLRPALGGALIVGCSLSAFCVKKPLSSKVLMMADYANAP
jgi:hypothetical protein